MTTQRRLLHEPEVRRALVDQMRTGASISAAVRAARVSRTTWYATRALAIEAGDLVEGDWTDDQRLAVELFAELAAARADAQLAIEGALHQMALQDFRAAKFVLSRIDGESWPDEHVRVTHQHSVTQGHVMADLSDPAVVVPYLQARAELGHPGTAEALAVIEAHGFDAWNNGAMVG